jgi:hypothetical protein
VQQSPAQQRLLQHMAGKFLPPPLLMTSPHHMMQQSVERQSLCMPGKPRSQQLPQPQPIPQQVVQRQEVRGLLAQSVGHAKPLSTGSLEPQLPAVTCAAAERSKLQGMPTSTSRSTSPTTSRIGYSDGSAHRVLRSATSRKPPPRTSFTVNFGDLHKQNTVGSVHKYQQITRGAKSGKEKGKEAEKKAAVRKEAVARKTATAQKKPAATRKKDAANANKTAAKEKKTVAKRKKSAAKKKAVVKNAAANMAVAMVAGNATAKTAPSKKSAAENAAANKAVAKRNTAATKGRKMPAAATMAISGAQGM